MRDAGMVAVELLLRDERHRGVIVGEVVRHLDDGLLDSRQVGTFLGHDEALARVLLTRGQLRLLAVAHGFERRGDGHGVLARIGHALDATNGVAVTLRDAAAPERVVLALGQHAGSVQTSDGEHAWIPARRDDGHIAALLRSGIHLGEMGGDVRMGIERVDYVEQVRACGRLLRQVVRAAAA